MRGFIGGQGAFQQRSGGRRVAEIAQYEHDDAQGEDGVAVGDAEGGPVPVVHLGLLRAEPWQPTGRRR